MVENKDIQTEYDLFTDVWKLFKGYYITQDNEAYWDNLIRTSHEIETKYQSKLSKDLIIAVVMELERKHIKEREEKIC